MIVNYDMITKIEYKGYVIEQYDCSMTNPDFTWSEWTVFNSDGRTVEPQPSEYKDIGEVEAFIDGLVS